MPQMPRCYIRRAGFVWGSACFECPLPDCIESGTGRAAYLRDQATLALFEQHKDKGVAKAVELVSQATGLTSRSVYRALKRRAA